MRLSRDNSSSQTRVVVLTADAEFDASVRSTFGASKAIDLAVVSGTIAGEGEALAAVESTIGGFVFDEALPV